MGTSFEQLHIFRKDVPPGIISQHVQAAVHDELTAHGYEQVDAKAPRIIQVVYDADDLWVSLYDDTWADTVNLIQNPQDFVSTGDLFNAVMQMLDTYPAVQLEVYDSDAAVARLYYQGKLLDNFSDWLNFEDMPKQRTGNAEKWQIVLPQGVSPQQLEEAWQTDPADYPFESEGIVRRIATLLQINQDRVWENEFEADFYTDLYFRRITQT